MTPEQLQRANELSEKTKELEVFQKAFNNGYVNYIRAVNYNGDKPCNKSINVYSGDELHTLINDYVDKRLRELKTEFENL